MIGHRLDLLICRQSRRRTGARTVEQYRRLRNRFDIFLWFFLFSRQKTARKGDQIVPSAQRFEGVSTSPAAEALRTCLNNQWQCHFWSFAGDYFLSATYLWDATTCRDFYRHSLVIFSLLEAGAQGISIAFAIRSVDRTLQMYFSNTLNIMQISMNP